MMLLCMRGRGTFHVHNLLLSGRRNLKTFFAGVAERGEMMFNRLHDYYRQKSYTIETHGRPQGATLLYGIITCFARCVQ